MSKETPDVGYILEVFGEGGYLAQQIRNYKPRPGQIQLACSIDKAIREGRHVIGEGPTGTGKSLAYATPAAYHAVYSGKKIGVVTANKNLQRQVYKNDLQDLADAVPWPFTFAIRKGMGSYVCSRNLRENRWRDLLFEEPSLGQSIEETREWAERTSTGDFEDSPGPVGKVWAAFSTNRDDCDGRRCGDFEDCFVNHAKERAAGAHITVTNYHLFFLSMRFPRGKILPAFDVVILDEAHRAANIARDFFGIELSFSAFYRCVTSLHMVDEVRGFKTKGKKLRDTYLGMVNAFFRGLGDRARARKNVLLPGDCKSEGLEDLLEEIEEFYMRVAAAIEPDRTPESSLDSWQAQLGAEAGRYCKLAEMCRKRRDELAEVRAADRQGMVYFVEGTGYEEKGRRVKLKSKAIEVGGYMRKVMFEPYPTIVQTSATLAIRGGGNGKSDFEYLHREMGMVGLDGIEELSVESPFDWPKQALLVIPRSMPEFKYGDTSWDQAVCEHFEEILNAVGGRTLGLFTSFRMLDITSKYLRDNTSWNIMVQREATNRELADRFQEDTESVLLGTESFSEGVSIEGEACTCVVLDKIPFISKDDPVLQGIKRENPSGNVFESHMLPEAIISFKQRIGRLIRTVTDVGVVVVLDKRLLTKRYRHQFIKSIPPLRVEEDVAAIVPFLKRVGAL
jgi:ATP-dependent DNA helicase DinG